MSGESPESPPSHTSGAADAAFHILALSGGGYRGLYTARILADLRWDAVEDLSRLVGDVAAYRAERWVRGALGVKGEVAWRLASAYAEHLKEETPLLCKHAQVDAWHAQVDHVRDDVARAAWVLADPAAAAAALESPKLSDAERAALQPLLPPAP